MPLYFCPTARIPGTAEEESVSKSCSVPLPFGGLQGRRRTIHVWRGVIANDGGIDEQSQQLVLVLGGAVLEERRRVWVGSCQRRCTDGRARRIHTVVADGHVHGSLGHGSADGSEESCKLEKHVDDGIDRSLGTGRRRKTNLGKKGKMEARPRGGYLYLRRKWSESGSQGPWMEQRHVSSKD